MRVIGMILFIALVLVVFVLLPIFMIAGAY